MAFVGTGKTRAQQLALVLGVGYVLGGIAGFFVTGFDDFAVNTDEALLFFEVNPFHNIAHIGIGALWLAAALLFDHTVSEGTHIAIGTAYLLVTAVGFAGYLEPLSIDGPLAADNFLHAGTTAAAFFAGLVVGPTERTPALA